MTWNTENEQDLQGFDVQHSLNGVDFASIGFEVPGQNKYLFLHTKPANGINYYRLKMIDTDGKFYYSEIQSVTLLVQHELVALYPNPTDNGIFTVDFLTIPITEAQLTLTTTTGHILHTFSITNLSPSNHTKKLYLPYADGIYFLKIAADNYFFPPQKIVIQR